MALHVQLQLCLNVSDLADKVKPGSAIERLHMMTQHSNSLATAMAAILVHNENLLRLCTKMAAISMAKGRMQMLYSVIECPLLPPRVVSLQHTRGGGNLRSEECLHAS